MVVIVEQPYNTTMKQGMPWRRRIRVTDTSTGDPIDISTYTFSMSVKPKAGSATTYIALTSANGRITIVDGPDGVFQLLIDEDDVNDLSFSTASYDLFSIDGSSTPKRLLGGKITLVPRVTEVS
jgi:hypothetical protein